MKNFFLAILTLAAISGVSGQNLKLPNDKSASTITYSMKHPLHQWDGVSRDVNSILLTDPEKSKFLQVAVKAKLSTFDSKNANRDSHMIEVAEGLKFPDVTFVSSEITVSGDQFTAHGKLTFHGVNKPATVTGTIARKKDRLTFTGTFPVKMSEFGIEPPSLLGMATEDEFIIKFDLTY